MIQANMFVLPPNPLNTNDNILDIFRHTVTVDTDIFLKVTQKLGTMLLPSRTLSFFSLRWFWHLCDFWIESKSVDGDVEVGNFHACTHRSYAARWAVQFLEPPLARGATFPSPEDDFLNGIPTDATTAHCQDFSVEKEEKPHENVFPLKLSVHMCTHTSM